MPKRIITTIFTVLTLFCAVIQVRAEENNIGDTTQNWRYIVPPAYYEYCDILPINGLIKVGRKVAEYNIGGDGPRINIMVYGLLSREGDPLTEISFDDIGNPNSDGYMFATKKDKDGQTQDVLINHLGQILPTPEGAVITLFDRSYSVETADELILYVNNKSYPVFKKVLESAGAHTDSMNVLGVYSNCFILRCDETVFVFGFDGTLRYKTDWYVCDSPQGLCLKSETDKIGFVDFDGNIIVPFIYHSLYPIYGTSGIFYFSIYPQLINSFGILDISNPEALYIPAFSSFIRVDAINRMVCMSTYTSGMKPKAGLYSFNWKEILPFEYDYIGEVGDSLIRFERTNLTGYIDLDGNIVFANELHVISQYFDFSEGLAGYIKTDGVRGFMNMDFEPVIELDEHWRVTSYSGFNEGLAAVFFNDELVFINRAGEIVIAQKPGLQPWRFSTGFSNGLAVVSEHEPVAGPSYIMDQYNHSASGVIVYTGNGSSE